VLRVDEPGAGQVARLGADDDVAPATAPPLGDHRGAVGEADDRSRQREPAGLGGQVEGRLGLDPRPLVGLQAGLDRPHERSEVGSGLVGRAGRVDIDHAPPSVAFL
jgi:hypothetical protein